MVDGGASLQEKSITGESMAMNGSISSTLDESSSAYDPTRRAPLMCTRRLFGKLETGKTSGQEVSEAIDNNSSRIDEGLYDESVELLKFRDGGEDQTFPMSLSASEYEHESPQVEPYTHAHTNVTSTY